nr:PAS domain-containing protein [Thiomicrorhabdus marina]
MVADDVDYALIVMDEQGTIIYANVRALNIAGFHSSEFMYKNIDMLMLEPGSDQPSQCMEDYLSSNSETKAGTWKDVTIQKKSGERTIFKMKVEALTLDDKTNFIAKIFTLDEYSKRYMPTAR